MRRIRSIVLATTMAVSVLALPPQSIAHAAGGTITGVVVDSSGAPIAGATVVGVYVVGDTESTRIRVK